MDALKTPLFAALGARLQFLGARSAVIAENIANADTPGYAARDLQQSDFSVRVNRHALLVSDPRHIAHGGGAAVTARPSPAPDADASLNGNKVSLETQTMKLAETRMEYDLAASVYRKGLSMLRLAARGGR